MLVLEHTVVAVAQFGNVSLEADMALIVLYPGQVAMACLVPFVLFIRSSCSTNCAVTAFSRIFV